MISKKTKWLWRAVGLLVCIMTVAVLFMYSNQLNQKNYKMLYDQTSILSRVITRQAALTAYEPVVTKDSAAINQLITNLEQEDYILDVSIYDKEGNFLDATDNALSLSELTGLNAPLSIASFGRHQLVEPIALNGKLAGFLRLTLEHGKIIKTASNQLNRSIELSQALIFIAIICGGFLTFLMARRIEFWLAPYLSRTHL